MKVNSCEVKTIITNHPDVGYKNNVDVIETALRERFGLSDASYVMTAIAAHIWSSVCGKAVKEWGIKEIKEAIHQVECRVGILKRQTDSW